MKSAYRVVQLLVYEVWVQWVWRWCGMSVGPCGSPRRCLTAWWCPRDWLWCSSTLLLQPCLTCLLVLLRLTLVLLHFASTASAMGHELLNRESPLSCMATSFILLSTDDDPAWGEEWAHKGLLPLDRDGAVHITLWSPALTRCWPSSSCSSAMNWSWHL